MLTESQLDILEGRIAALYQELESNVIADVARRIKKTGVYTETAEIQARALRELGFSPDRIRKEAFKLLRADNKYVEFVGKNTLEYKACVKREIKATVSAAKLLGNDLIANAGDMSFAYDLNLWERAGKTLDKSGVFYNLVNQMQKRTSKDLTNITRSTGFKGASGFTAVRDAYTHQLDLALIKTMSGAFSFDQAVEDCVKDLTQSGLRTVSYSSGRTYQLDTAARMCVRTASEQLAGDIALNNAKEGGEDLVEVSSHWGARPSHQVWQGKIYSLSGNSDDYEDFYDATGYGEADGLCGVNCRHTFYTFFAGISKPTKWEPEPEPTEYNGRTYTYTEATQEQRRQERAIRATKREIAGYKAIGVEKPELQGKLRMQKKRYHDFSDACGIRAKDNRLRVWSGERTTRGNLDYMSNSFRPRYGEEKDILLDSTKMSVRQVKNSSFDMITDTKNTRNKAVRLAEKMFKEIQKDLPETFKLPQVAVVDFEKQGLNVNAIGGYHEHTGILFINSKYDTKQKILDFVNKNRGYFANTTVYAPYLHELGHKYYYDSIKKLASKENRDYNKAKKVIDGKIYDYVHEKNVVGDFLIKNMSIYAAIGFKEHNYTEIIAESFSAIKSNAVAKEIIDLIDGMR